jgi:hypothetical protein
MPEKTTVFPKIFTTILLLSAFLSAAGGEILTTGEAPEEVQRELADTAARITKIFRVPYRRSPRDLVIAFSPAVPESSAELQFRGGKYVLMLNGSPGRDADLVWKRKVYSALLLAAAGAPFRPGETHALPPWTIAALDRMLAARQREERLLAGNRRSPVMSALLGRDKLPAVAAVHGANPADFDPAARFWMEESARALFLAGGKKLASAEYLLRCAGAEPSGADPDLYWLPADPKRRERDFRLAARIVAWHEHAPRPARWTIRKFAELRKLKMPVLDEKGAPVPEKFVEFDVSEVAERLRGRPDAKARCMEFHDRFLEFSFGDSHPARLAISELADLMSYADDPPFRYNARLRDRLEKIDTVLKRQEALERYLAEADFRYAPARRAFRYRLTGIEWANARSALLSQAAREWVNEAEAGFR